MPDANSNDSNAIRLVCAGLGRTGTLSLTEALETLGYKPYHYLDFSHSKEWADLAEGTGSTETVLDKIIGDGYDAVLENPTCDIYTDILERFPDTKVILTVRDTPQAFESSWKVLMETMIVTEAPFSISFPSFFQWVPIFRHLKSIRRFMGTTHLGLPEGALAHGWRDQPEGWLAEQYTKHNDHVIASVPSDRLLVFNVKEGWEPLCEFLGCDVPSGSFPHSQVNTKESLKGLKQTFERAVYGWIPVVVGLVAAGAAVLAKRGKRY